MTPSRHEITVGLIQKACTADRALNQASLDTAIRDCAAQGVELILLQELHDSLYFCQTEDTARFDLAESIPGPSSERLGRLAADLQVVIVASLFERRAPGLYHNTAVVLDSDGSLAGRYRKMHVPDDPGYYEKFYFTPGDLGFRPVETSLGKLGVLVCWDQWYPEAARLTALAGAEILLYPTAIGWNPADDTQEQQRQLDAWITIQRAHAVANGLPLIAANRVGFEADPSGQTQGAQFWGHSMICGPQGEILAQAGSQECLLTARIDRQRTEEVRRIWPFFRDRRIDAYGPLLKRYDEGC
ncbi:MAG: carbon-nitrogen hydrolase [Gammaproteobacteria bacterium]|nr:carbon-nitrogen hydrolase [Gammaproteobacteria bacterium]MBU1654010.1 carbon-nitrogen hydrolase [Gammaproteobacteria bacterium]MBU1960731.1 carbon-nitrogen hydrolase [Gammaproteobacteria bacterium]